MVPLFALLLMVIAGVAGMAMDFSRQERMRARLSQSADAAILAAARGAANLQENNPSMDVSEIILQAQTLGEKHFKANVGGLGDVTVDKVDLSVKYDGGYWTSSVAYKATGRTTLGAALGQSKLDLRGKSEASIAPGFPVLDIAMCIDSTGSMQPTLDAVKSNAINFYDNLNASLTAKGIQPFPHVRVRLIYFKDFGDATPGLWDPDPLVASNFFRLPDDAGNFNAFAAPQVAGGGGDWTESGLECLNEAMDSQWIQVGQTVSGFTQRVTDVYPLIVIWTDASAHRVSYPNSLANPDYPPPSKMPRTYADFLAKWENREVIDQHKKQLLFFGDPAQPAGEPDGGESGWSEIMNWPKFTLGGTLLEANTDPVEFIANGIAKNTKGLRLTN
ncbi:MAG: pilus assembly protein TadG-related protein [Hyphomonas sp.]|nr:pilus assembly protein TadG-related protein [Hyphomonas sp.]